MHTSCVGLAWQVLASGFESVECINHACYHPYLVSMLFADMLTLHLLTFLMFGSTPHVAALALQALMAVLSHALASFPGSDQLFVICSVCEGVECSLFDPHCSCSNSANPKKQHMFVHWTWKVEISSYSSSLWQIHSSRQLETCVPKTISAWNQDVPSHVL